MVPWLSEPHGRQDHRVFTEYILITCPDNTKTRESLAKQSDCFCMAKTCVPEGKKYSLLAAELKYRKDIVCGAELCALHL